MQNTKKEKMVAMKNAMLTASQIEKNATMFWTNYRTDGKRGKIVSGIKNVPANFKGLFFDNQGRRQSADVKTATPNKALEFCPTKGARYFLLSAPEGEGKDRMQHAAGRPYPLVVFASAADFTKYTGAALRQ